MIRIFSHYVSKTAFILLLLEIMILLLSATLTSLLWLADGSRVLRVSELYLSSSIFALVIVLSMSALGMYQHRSREDI
ncbi:MAG: sugar transferase, partial [Janthinobacterium sp.]